MWEGETPNPHNKRVACSEPLEEFLASINNRSIKSKDITYLKSTNRQRRGGKRF
jgi:hypothetical protein